MLDGHRDLAIVGYFLRQRIVSPSRKPCSIAFPSEERRLPFHKPKLYSTPGCPDRRDCDDDKILHPSSYARSTSAGQTLTPGAVFDFPSLFSDGSRAGCEEQPG